MSKKAIQDHYPDDVARCYGCGKLNSEGYQLKTYWVDDESVSTFTPAPYHTAVEGFVYGGLIASLIDCHSTGTAAAAAYRQAGREIGSEPGFRFVTGSLHVDYLKPTPLGVPLEIRGTIEEIKGRKVIVRSTLKADGQICAKGRVVAVEMPEHFQAK